MGFTAKRCKGFGGAKCAAAGFCLNPKLKGDAAERGYCDKCIPKRPQYGDRTADGKYEFTNGRWRDADGKEVPDLTFCFLERGLYSGSVWTLSPSSILPKGKRRRLIN